jgi:D-alanyl-D-alanine dipeptidase
MHWCKALLAAILALLAWSSGEAFAQSCPAPLVSARRLVLVTSDRMTVSTARVRLFERAAPGARWRPLGAAMPATIGRRGMAWGYPFRALARRGEPVKVEGDRRTPIGAYRIGRSFGFAASPRPGYLHITGQTMCVDDPRSPAYSRIASSTSLPAWVHGEHMRRDLRYRRGLLVDYSTSRAKRGGSCLFLHVWKSPGYPTIGCIALSEPRIARLQDFAQAGAVLVVLPRQAIDRFAGCLPAEAR